MAIVLDPAPQELGLAAPLLGPWFKPATIGQVITLPAPDPARSLSLQVDLGTDGTEWLPPAAGTLSLFVADSARPPPPIAHLQDGAGRWPFATGSLVAWFRLLPEVEERLHDLSRLLPPVTGTTLTTPPATPFGVNHRARVRGFALVPTLAHLDHDAVMTLLGGGTNVPGDTDARQLTAVGLALKNGAVVNGAFPMTRLRRPGRFEVDPNLATAQDVILGALTGPVELWAFDHRGRPLDPGAVAAWWSWLLNTGIGPASPGGPLQLLAPGINPLDLPQGDGRPLVCTADPGRATHLVDAHEGVLGPPFLGDRLQAGGTAVNRSLVPAGTGAAVQLSIAPVPPPGSPPPPDNPAVDSAPRARLAVLPAGTYATTLTLWPDGAAITPGLDRDFVRTAAVDEERHLIGVARGDSRATPTSADERRRGDQNRPSTQVNVARTATTGPVLLATADAGSTALAAVLAGPGPTRAMLGIADAETGPVPGPGLSPTSGQPFPVRLAASATLDQPGTYRVRALAGGGPADADQAVLVEIELGSAHDGAWVRAWPLGFRLESGLRPRTTGGGGRVGAGQAALVVTLPKGRLDASGLLSFDAQVSRLDGNGQIVSRVYADCRFERPAPVAGDPATAIAGSWVICETGVTGTGSLPAGSVPPGASVVLLGQPPAVVARTAVPASARAPGTLGAGLTAGDLVSLTEPAFGAATDRVDALGRPLARVTAGGDPAGGLTGLAGVVVHRLSRQGPAAATASSAPFALQDRLEVAAASVTGGPTPTASAVIAGGARLPLLHEQLPHFLGHPGTRAAIETHATAAALDGPPALAVAELARERTAGLSFGPIAGAAEPERSVAVQSELAVAAEAAPFPVVPPSPAPGPVAAVLRTGPVGQEGIPGLAQAASTLAVYPLSQHASDLQSFLDNTNLPGGAGPLGTFLRAQIGPQVDSITRALDRRLLAGIHGARETALSLAAAFDRANDLVYIETPAIDHRPHGPDDDRLDLLQHLVNRLGQRPGLRVILCVPSLLGPGTPKKLQAVRDAELLKAVGDLRSAATDRVAVFSPGVGAGRALRLATTTVVIDDVYAVTGTTHLWRRGLTFDSSLAVAVFDQRLVDGRPQEVRAFRRQLLADRLGLAETRLPDDPDELVRAILMLDETAPKKPDDDFGARPSQRRSALPILAPPEAPTDVDVDTWDPDGSRGDLDLAALLAAVALTDPDHAIVDD